MLNAIFAEYLKKALYTEFRYAEYRGAHFINSLDFPAKGFFVSSSFAFL